MNDDYNPEDLMEDEAESLDALLEDGLEDEEDEEESMDFAGFGEDEEEMDY